MVPITKYKNGFLIFIGYLLSPLSWWNDLYINFPIAIIMALPTLLFGDKFFVPAFICFYWLTNVVGLLLLHKGTQKALSAKTDTIWFSKKEIKMDLQVSTIYTLVIAFLAWRGYLRAPTKYDIFHNLFTKLIP